MSTETKDAPAKTPSKGFSLRSRLLGIPVEGTPEAAASVDETPASDQPATDAPTEPTAADAVAQAPAPSSEDNDEADEPPRVGLAVAPKRSLLSMAFGVSDKKAKAEKAKFEEVAGTPTTVAEPEPVVE